MSRQIYLDFNASTPICPEAVEAMRPFLTDHYGNPSSLHWAGMPAKDAIEKARGQAIQSKHFLSPLTSRYLLFKANTRCGREILKRKCCRQ